MRLNYNVVFYVLRFQLLQLLFSFLPRVFLRSCTRRWKSRQSPVLLVCSFSSYGCVCALPYAYLKAAVSAMTRFDGFSSGVNKLRPQGHVQPEKHFLSGPPKLEERVLIVRKSVALIHTFFHVSVCVCVKVTPFVMTSPSGFGFFSPSSLEALLLSVAV